MTGECYFYLVITLLLLRSHGSEWRAPRWGTAPVILAIDDAVEEEPDPGFVQSVVSSIRFCSLGEKVLMKRAWFGCKKE